MLVIYPTNDIPATSLSLVTDDYGFLYDLFNIDSYLCEDSPWRAANAFAHGHTRDWDQSI